MKLIIPRPYFHILYYNTIFAYFQVVLKFEDKNCAKGDK